MATYTSLWLLFSLAATALAQGSSIIPSGLTSGFTDSIGLEVSFQGVASRFDGIPDGSTVAAKEVSTGPIFALSDQSAVNTRIAFLVMMLDTTDANAPVLHFAQDQFKADGEQTGIASQAQPLVPYAGPGSLGETGQRQYSFLLFQEPSGTTISGLPKAGETLNVDQFLTANNMRAARAGVGILVDNGGGGGGGAAAPSASATPVAPSNTPIATFTSVIPTPTGVTSEAPVSLLPTLSWYSQQTDTDSLSLRSLLPQLRQSQQDSPCPPARFSHRRLQARAQAQRPPRLRQHPVARALQAERRALVAELSRRAVLSSRLCPLGRWAWSLVSSPGCC